MASHLPGVAGNADDIGEVSCVNTHMMSLNAGDQITVSTYIAWASASTTIKFMRGTGFSGQSLF